MQLRFLSLAATALIAVLLGACTMTPATHFYTLHGFPEETERNTVKLPDHTYGVGPIFLPEALMQPGIVSHREGQELKVSLYNIWAGNLRSAITRVLAANISHVSGVQAVWPFPWDNRNRPVRQVRVVFEQLSGEVGGQVVLKAKWALTEHNGEHAIIERRVELSEKTSSDTMGAYVATLNELINQLSVEIASALQTLD